MNEKHSHPDQLNHQITKDLNQLSFDAYAVLLEQQMMDDCEPKKEQNYSYILVIEGEAEENVIYLEDKLYEIGRRHDATIKINDQSVSRYHATIIKEYNPEKNLFFYKMIDGDVSGRKSKNGLTINNKNYKSKYLEHGDLINFSQNTEATFYVVNKDSINDSFLADSQNQGEKIKNRLEDYEKQTLTDSVDDSHFYLGKDRIFDYICKLSSLAKLSPYPIIEINLQGKLTYHNSAATKLFPNLKEETMSHPLLSDLLVEQHRIKGNLFVREVQYEEKTFEQYIHYLPEFGLIRSYIFDFTERKEIESQLKDSEAKYKAVVKQTSEGILLFNADDLQIIEANVSASRILHCLPDEITQKNINFFLMNRQEEFIHKLKILKQHKLSFIDEFKFKVNYNNQPIDVELSVNVLDYHHKLVFCCVFRDITRRKKLERELRYKAYYDDLTGLYKRNFFRDFFANTLDESKNKKESSLAIMFLDVDRFKQINDNYGHDVGDLLLKQFAQRLKNCVKKNDCLARWGGDEFTVLLTGIVSHEQIVSICERIIESMNNPFVCTNVTVKTSTSIGVAVFPNDGDTVESLMKKADQALYQTKENGRNGYSIYGNNSRNLK